MLPLDCFSMNPLPHASSTSSIMQTEHLDVKKLWDDALVTIELGITPANFKTWFKDTHIISLEDGTITLGVPSVFVRDWLSDKFQPLILKVLRDLTPHVRSIEYAVVQRSDKKQSSKPQTVNAALPLEEYYINKSDNLNPKYVFDTFVIGPFNALAHAAAKTVSEKPGITYNPLFIYGKNRPWKNSPHSSSRQSTEASWQKGILRDQ